MLEYIVRKTSLVETFDFLEETLDPIDYIIYWNAKQAYKYKFNSLTRDYLELLLTRHASRWINPRSILKERLKGHTSKEYIQSKINKMLSNDAEYEGALTALVLDRFDEVMRLEATEEELEDKINEQKRIAEYRFAEGCIMKLAEISIGKEVNIGKAKFSRDSLPDAFKYIANELETNFTQSTGYSYRNGIIERLADTVTNYDNIIQLNIGKNICSPLKSGDLWSVIAEEKVGKTKFVLGEIVYNAIRNNKNVRVCSGEMSEAEVLSAVIVKHIYVTTKQKLDAQEVGAYISYTAAIESGSKIPKNIVKRVSKITSEMKELIDTAFHQLIEGQGMGKLLVPTMRDEKRIAKEGDDFCIKGGKERMIKLIKRDDIDIIVWDHMGFFHTPEPTSDKLMAEQAVRVCLDIAKNSEKPVGVVCINHTMTGVKYDNIKAIRSFGTSAAEKDAAVGLVLVQTPEDAADGLASIIVQVDRYTNTAGNFGGQVFPVYADKMINDFLIVGTEKKDYGPIEKVTDKDLDNSIQTISNGNIGDKPSTSQTPKPQSESQIEEDNAGKQLDSNKPDNIKTESNLSFN